MSENQNRNYSKYDTMATEELEKILRLDAASLEGEDSDTELLLYVMEVLANRRRNTDITGKTALESWESFQENYLNEEYPEDMQEPKKNRTAAPWLRRLIAAAAVIALVVGLSLPARAFGLEEIWNIFARWAKETFSFVTEESSNATDPDTEYRGGISSLQDLLEQGEHDASMVPTWIPEGFALESLERDATPVQEVYIAYYTCDDREFEIRIRNHLAMDIQSVEIEEESGEIYTVLDVEYYIFDNMDQIQIMWLKDSYECNISGDLSIDEAKKMIDSIGKG